MFFAHAHSLGGDFFNSATQHLSEVLTYNDALYWRGNPASSHLAKFSEFVLDAVLPELTDYYPDFRLIEDGISFDAGEDIGINGGVHRDNPRLARRTRTNVFVTLGTTSTGMTLGTLFPKRQFGWPSEVLGMNETIYGRETYEKDFVQPPDKWAAVFLPDIEYHCSPLLDGGFIRWLYRSKLVFERRGKLRKLSTTPREGVLIPEVTTLV